MAMTSTLHVQVSLAWWVVPYIQSVAFFAWTMGLHPDVEKVTRTAMRGIRCSIAR